MVAERPPTTPPAGSAPARGDSSFWNVLLPVLSFIGTGIGLLGFVIFFGGFILWTRFEAAGLPADDAVAHVPRNDLVVTGASFLVPALLAAVVAVAVAVVLRDATLGNLRRQRKERAEHAHAQAVADLQETRVRADEGARRRQSLLGQMNAHQQMARELEDPAEAQKAFDAYLAAKAEHQRAEPSAESLVRDVDAAEHREQEALAACRKADSFSRRDRLLQIAAGGMPMVAAYALIGALGWAGLGWWPLVGLVLFALLTISVAIAVISMTQRFAWFALCVFVGVGLVIAASTYVRTDSTTKLSPVAVIADGMPVTGFFVAEADDAVYVAQGARKDGRGLVFDHAAATLLRLEKDHVSALAIGPVMREANAYRRALQLGITLCLRPRPAAAQGGAATTAALDAGASKRHARTSSRKRAARALTCARQDTAGLQRELARA
jgi:hypothetical protein